MKTQFKLMVFVCLLFTHPAIADDRRQPSLELSKPIRFAQSAALSGTAAQLGLQMQRGILAAFNEVNMAGGINGRKLILSSFDDGYEPEQAIVNVEQFVGNDDVVALIGGVGTPTSLSILDLVQTHKISYLAPMTGAMALRGRHNVLNLRSSYAQEVEAIVDWFVGAQGFDRIGVLFQDDSYGRSGLRALHEALSSRGLKIHVQASYLRNSTAIKSALLEIRDSNPQAVLLVATYTAAAATVKWSRILSFNPSFATLSFVGSEALRESLGTEANGIYVSQVVPSPTLVNVPLVQNYRAALDALQPGVSPTFASLEGYLAGRVAVQLMRSISGEIDRASLLAATRAIRVLTLDGLTISLTGGRAGVPVTLTRFTSNGLLELVSGT